MKTPTIAILAAIGIFALSTGSPRLYGGNSQMDDAIAELELAKNTREHIKHLEEARRHLQIAEKNKAGERVAAIKEVDDAIDAARKSQYRRMEDYIASAIAHIQEGKRKALGK